MAVVRVHNRGGCRHAGFGKQPTRCQIQSWQSTFPTAAVRALSIDPAEYASGALNTAAGPEPLKRAASAEPVLIDVEIQASQKLFET